MADLSIRTLQNGITVRQDHLNAATKLLAQKAQKYSVWANCSSAITVVLGALVAARSVAERTFSEAGVAITFAIFGVIIASTAGLEAAFKLKDRAAKLRSLANLSESTQREIDTKWRKEVASVDPSPARIKAAHRLLDLQDETITNVQKQAADVGVNLPLGVNELMEGGQQLYAA